MNNSIKTILKNPGDYRFIAPLYENITVMYMALDGSVKSALSSSETSYIIESIQREYKRRVKRIVGNGNPGQQSA